LALITDATYTPAIQCAEDGNTLLSRRTNSHALRRVRINDREFMQFTKLV